jgi:hypothetical protein
MTRQAGVGVQVLQKAWNLFSDDVKAILQLAESNLSALNTVHLGPKRPFSVGECALWARLFWPRFAAQVAAAASLVEAPANHLKATTVAKEVMAIMLGNQTGLSIEMFFESPFAGKHPKLINTSTEAAAAEAAVTAAEAIAVADLEEAKRLAAEFEAMGGGALTMAIAQEAEPGDPLRKCWLAHERLRVSEARSIKSRKYLRPARTLAPRRLRLPPRRPPSRKLPPPWKLPPSRKLPPPRGPLRKPPPMRLACERPWRPSF